MQTTVKQRIRYYYNRQSPFIRAIDSQLCIYRHRLMIACMEYRRKNHDTRYVDLLV